MADDIKLELTDAQIAGFTVKSLLKTQAMLTVALETQALILAELQGVRPARVRRALNKAVAEAEDRLALPLQGTPSPSGAARRGRSAPSSLIR